MLSSKSVGKVFKFIPVTRTKLRIIHTLLSILTVSTCAAYLYEYNGLLQMGKIWHSPTIWIIIGGEFLRWIANKNYLNIEANPREILTAKPKKSSFITRIKDAFKLAFLLSAFTVFYAFICIVFGAPALRNYEETLTLSCLLTSLTILPLCLYLGPSATLRYLFSDSFELSSKSQVAFLELIQYNAIGAILGAWFGSVVSPLDWDRDWQMYPIPNMCGAIVGFLGANLHTMGMALLKMIKRGINKKWKTN